MAVLSVRKPGNSTISVCGSTCYWSGHSDGHRLQGVAIPIFSRLHPSAVITPVSECTMALRLKLAFDLVLHMAVYAPTGVCKLVVKEVFYAKLASVTDSCHQQDTRYPDGPCTAVGR